MRAYKTGWRRGWYRQNVSGKRKFGSSVEVLKIQLFDFYHYVWIYIINNKNIYPYLLSTSAGLWVRIWWNCKQCSPFRIFICKGDLCTEGVTNPCNSPWSEAYYLKLNVFMNKMFINLHALARISNAKVSQSHMSKFHHCRRKYSLTWSCCRICVFYVLEYAHWLVLEQWLCAGSGRQQLTLLELKCSELIRLRQ